MKVPAYAIHDDKMISGFFGDYRFLSNFWPAPMTLEGIMYPTVEHAFQAWKAPTIVERRLIAAAPTPGKAKAKGNTLKIRPDWDDIRFDVMQFLVTVKFMKSPILRQMLVDTGDKQLIEANDWGDKRWGEAWELAQPESNWPAGTWVNLGGDNYLGKILTRIRKMVK